MSTFPIVDTHVHLWDPEHIRQSWVDTIPLMNHRYLLPEYQEQTQAADSIEIEAMVFMECGVDAPYAFLEAQWAVQYAQAHPKLAGIVAAAPLEFGTRTRAYLEALVALGPLVKGVRRNLQDEKELDFCLQPGFVQGVKLLPEYNLSFDICIRHQQLPTVIELVRRCPEAQFILDHIGKPAIKEQILDPWRQQMTELAALPNVYCKVSGLVTEADYTTWQSEDLTPYIEHVLTAFGEERVIFAGDWPVILQASSYARWVETLQTLTATRSENAQRKLWNENARHFYRLRDK